MPALLSPEIRVHCTSPTLWVREWLRFLDQPIQSAMAFTENRELYCDGKALRELISETWKQTNPCCTSLSMKFWKRYAVCVKLHEQYCGAGRAMARTARLYSRRVCAYVCAAYAKICGHRRGHWIHRIVAPRIRRGISA